MNMVQLDIDSLKRAANKIQIEWELKSLEFKRQALFTSWFFIGVLLFSCLVFPPATIIPVIALVLGLAGATICFTSILVLSKVRADVGMDKTRSEMLSAHLNKSEKSTLMDEQFQSYLARFKQLKSQPQDMQVTMEMKQLYLMMNQLVCRSEIQAHVLERQKIELWLTLARDILIPIIVVAMFIGMSTGVGLGIIAGLIVINIFMKKILDTYLPIMQHKVKFDENAYQTFKDTPTLNNLLSEEKYHANKNRFYQPLVEQSLAEKKLEADDNVEGDFTSGLDFAP